MSSVVAGKGPATTRSQTGPTFPGKSSSMAASTATAVRPSTGSHMGASAAPTNTRASKGPAGKRGHVNDEDEDPFYVSPYETNIRQSAMPGHIKSMAIVQSESQVVSQSNLQVVSQPETAPHPAQQNRGRPIVPGDFPSLGRSSDAVQPVNVTWGPKDKVENKASEEDNRFEFVKTKNSKKKNKEPVYDNGSTSAVVESKKKKKGKTKKEERKEDKRQEDSQESLEEDVVELETRKPDKATESKPKKKKTKSIKCSENEKFAKVIDPCDSWEDLVESSVGSHSTGSDVSSAASVGALKNQTNLPPTVSDVDQLVDQFPALAVSSKVVPPPPGLGPTKPPPPGFGTSSYKPPPPGFSSSTFSGLLQDSSQESENVPPVDVDGYLPPTLPDSVDGYLPPVPPSPVDCYLPPALPTVGTYIQLKDFQARNGKLIVDIQEVMGNDSDKFDSFKTCSVEFRQGLISGKDYYNKCMDIMGRAKFGQIFPELLVLLPNITKQQELLLAHNERKSGGKKKGGGWAAPNTDFSSCPSCMQVVASPDLPAHLLEHNFESDFPSLSGSPTKPPPGMKALVRAV